MIKGKTFLASLLISFGVIVNLILGNPIGPFLFAFGLLGVCVLEADLFTGKAGYYWWTRTLDLIKIFSDNIFWGAVIGANIGYIYPQLVPIAMEKVSTWSYSYAFFMQSVFCGMIMYIAVELYKRKNILGILMGVPLFIFCGFQHSIANIIIALIAAWSGIPFSTVGLVFFCALGNLLGSICINLIVEEK